MKEQIKPQDSKFSKDQDKKIEINDVNRDASKRKKLGAKLEDRKSKSAGTSAG
ncbi:MAG: hypothetical protein P4M14_07300 [Gammaproteobacteria bacterium]|nr:hypothetical protein [Gammaproteobacteria bacterium]